MGAVNSKCHCLFQKGFLDQLKFRFKRHQTVAPGSHGVASQVVDQLCGRIFFTDEDRLQLPECLLYYGKRKLHHHRAERASEDNQGCGGAQELRNLAAIEVQTDSDSRGRDANSTYCALIHGEFPSKHPQLCTTSRAG
jgi:hypothetical protein